MSPNPGDPLEAAGSDFLTVKLEEYKTLRSEVLLSLQQGQSVLSFGVAAIGVLLGFALGPVKGPAGIVLAAVGVPVIATLIVVVWLGELARTRRLGAFIKHRIETPAQTWLGERDSRHALEWETWMDQKANRAFGTHDRVVPALLLGLALLSISMALSQVLKEEEGEAWALLVIAVGFAVLVSACVYAHLATNKIANVENLLFPGARGEADGDADATERPVDPGGAGAPAASS